MCTLVWQRRQLTTQHCHSAVSFHHFHSDVHIAVTLSSVNIAVTLSSVTIAVTALSVVTATTLVCTVMLQRCHCHQWWTVVSLHRWHTSVAAIAVTVPSRPLLSQHSYVHRCHIYCHYHRCYLSGNCTAMRLVWRAMCLHAMSSQPKRLASPAICTPIEKDDWWSSSLRRRNTHTHTHTHSSSNLNCCATAVGFLLCRWVF